MLNVEQNNLELVLHRLYYNPKCQYFYIFLMASSVLLVVLTLIFGFKVESTFPFLAMEGCLNVLIFTDFLFRLKLLGLKRFF